jgi:imidazolonepropionase
LSKEALFIRHAKQLITIESNEKGPRKGTKMEELAIIEDGSIWIDDGKIVAVGNDTDIFNKYKPFISDVKIIDATGKIVTPGLVDPHTHLVFAGSRENEFTMRLNGATYMDIMNAGGGIHATTTATRKATHNELYEQASNRLDQFLLHGVTTVEAKSGYGLSLEHELKQLEVAKRLDETHPIDIVRTFMGAHAVPAQYKENPDEFVNIVISDMIPKIAELKLAEFNDVFCERGVFTPEQSKRILEAGVRYGLLPKIHADEIESYGGAELAAEIDAVSADHLLKASDEVLFNG